MSFDLGVWHATRALDTSSAEAVYQVICEGGDAPEGTLTPSPRVAAFMAALAARHPNLDSLPDEAVDDSPWSSGFEYSESHALLNIRWSRADEMLREVRELAGAHGLVLYDPQASEVYNPTEPAPNRPWQFWRP